MKRSGHQIERSYKLVAALLAGRELDRRSVAKLIGVREAAADTHINALVELVKGVEENRHRHRRTIRLDLDAASAPPSRPMAVAASFGASLAHLFRGSDYEGLLTKALDHVLGRIRKQADFREARRKFVFVAQGGEIALPDQQAMLDDLVEAVLRQERVALKYEHFDGTVKRIEIAPWSVVIYNHQLYVLAAGESMSPNIYRLSRMRSVTRRATTFEYPTRAEYDPEVVFRDTFGIFVRGDDPVEDVVLRLHPRWRTYARTHRWHASQHVDKDSKQVIVRLRVRTCPEFEAFILGFGDDAEVLEPLGLRRKVASRARAMGRVYTEQPRSGRRRRADP